MDLIDPASQQSAIDWWTDLTARGGEGMVVKPFQFIAKGRRGLAQPAIKCRGREYLRIIYGPDYTAPKNLDRLRSRGLSAKRSLALREFALGIEALERKLESDLCLTNNAPGAVYQKKRDRYGSAWTCESMSLRRDALSRVQDPTHGLGSTDAAHTESLNWEIRCKQIKFFEWAGGK